MLNDMLKGYKKNDYVYIIEGCIDLYVSDKPCKDEPCSVCGDYEWPCCEGFVSDIRKAKDKEDLEKIQLLRTKNTYGQKNDETVIKHYLDSHLEDGIKQKNLDTVLDLIDEYIEVAEAVSKTEQNIDNMIYNRGENGNSGNLDPKLFYKVNGIFDESKADLKEEQGLVKRLVPKKK